MGLQGQILSSNDNKILANSNDNRGRVLCAYIPTFNQGLSLTFFVCPFFTHAHKDSQPVQAFEPSVRQLGSKLRSIVSDHFVLDLTKCGNLACWSTTKQEECGQEQRMATAFSSCCGISHKLGYEFRHQYSSHTQKLCFKGDGEEIVQSG